MTKGKILGDIHQIDKDVELCRTTNERISNQAAQLLIENQIPFTRGWIKVPFFFGKIPRCTSDLCDPHEPQPLRAGKTHHRPAGHFFPAQTDLKQLLIRTHAMFLHCLRHQFLKQCQKLFSTSRIGHSRYSGSTAACGATSNNFSPVKCSNS